MANPNKPHFAKTFIDLNERAHQAFGHSAIGQAVTRAAAGSSYSGYRQLDWFSHGITTDVKTTVKVPGDPHAGPIPRFWTQAAIIASQREDLANIKNGKHYKEAIAYVSDDVVHVGTQATERLLFDEFSAEVRAIAMRLGKGPLEATMGIWIPQERHFIGVDDLRVIQPNALISGLPSNYPGMVLA